MTNEALPIFDPRSADEGEVHQQFPANQPASARRTAWRVRWSTATRRGGGSGSQAFAIVGAWFQRTPDEEFIQVVSDLSLTDILAYGLGSERVSVLRGTAVSLLPARASDLGPACIAPGAVVGAHVLKEVHDDQLRWKAFDNSSRRGQILTLWAGYDAGNYQYFVEYGFMDDGGIVPRLGVFGPRLSDAAPVYVHLGCWRFTPHLGDPERIELSASSLIQQADGSARVETVPFIDGREGGVLIDQEQFTVLRIANPARLNDHDPTRPVGYDLIPEAAGRLRLTGPGNAFAQADIWATRAEGADPAGAWVSDDYTALPLRTAAARPLAGHAKVLWHASPVVHWPRSASGAPPKPRHAHTQWGGFMLRPRELFRSTPMYP